MDEEIQISVSIPLDSDGYIRRECPTCEQQFKWFSHEADDPDLEPANQYFCPLCGIAAEPDQWWTTEQIELAEHSFAPAAEQMLQDAFKDALRRDKFLTYEPNKSFSLDVPTPEPLFEPDDMVIVEPPCHPNEPIKVPEGTTDCVHCLICGAAFAA